MERVVIFIDGSNFYHGLKNNFGKASINFERFSLKLTNGRKLIRTYYYNAPIDQKENPTRYQEQQRFFSTLDKVPYLETTLGRLAPRERTHKCPTCKKEETVTFHIEKGIDVKIAIDMVAMAYKNIYDVAILVSGDGDFDRAIKEVKDTGKHVENAYFKSGHSYQLMKICDKYIELSNSYLSDCWF